MASSQQQRQDALIRLLVYALGVAPHEFYLLPNAQGWVSIKELMRALNQDEHSGAAREGAIRQAATMQAPELLEITPSHIRARHREPIPMEYAIIPPGHLYFGARPKSYAHVLQNGLSAGEQGPLVLSPTKELALTLSSRREPEPIVLTIQARKASERGVVFDLMGSDMYLCQHVAPEFLLGPAAPEIKKPAQPAGQPTASAPEMGAFLLGESSKPYKQKGLKKDVAWKKERHRAKREKL